MNNEPMDGRVNPAAIPAADLARMLSKASGRAVPADAIAADVKSGAPANADGSLNLVHYAAWLVREAPP